LGTRVFIDGQEGTTGLQIHARLRDRADLTLLEIDPERRKDVAAKRALLHEAELAILCLPDAAAVETASLAGPNTRILDASSAHRVHEAWQYGLPELAPAQRAHIRDARLVSNPGCWPTGFLLLVRPLTEAGIIPSDYPISVHGQSGYSGGGKNMIAAFEAHAVEGPNPPWAARPYGLTLQHKHLPEMTRYSGLSSAPVFCPSVGHYYQGMLVHVPLHTRALGKRVDPAAVHACLSERYQGEAFVRVMPLDAASALEAGCLNATALNGTNRIELFVFGNREQILLTARLDNLGKGASAAAVQNLNLMLGRDELLGLADDERFARGPLA
jgi:N-acetyl-gamma-glutamyl-phosphate reductase